MAQICYHPSIEGAQHGAKSLPDFLDYAKASGAAGAQPSNYMLGNGKGGFLKAKEIKKELEERIKSNKEAKLKVKQQQIADEQSQLVEVRDLFQKQEEFNKNKHRYMESLKKADLQRSKIVKQQPVEMLLQTNISRERL